MFGPAFERWVNRAFGTGIALVAIGLLLVVGSVSASLIRIGVRFSSGVGV